MGEIQAVADQLHEDMKGELTLIQDSMAYLSRQVMELLHQNVNQPRG